MMNAVVKSIYVDVLKKRYEIFFYLSGKAIDYNQSIIYLKNGEFYIKNHYLYSEFAT